MQQTSLRRAIRPAAQTEPHFSTPEAAASWNLIQRILSSPHFLSSPRLTQLLLYLADCALRNAPEDATEQQIGVQVFHRKPGYNTGEDSIVRSQARLLRLKLAAYFSDEGSTEELRVEIPKGHYLPVFFPATAAEEALPFEETGDALPKGDVYRTEVTVLPPPEKPAKALHRRFLWTGSGIFLLLLVLLGAFLLGGARSHRFSQSSVDTLWAPFLKGEQPLLIYSNARFAGDSRTGLHYIQNGTSAAAGEHVVDHYTGIGEVSAVRELTQLFDRRQADFILKRSLLVTWDEARSKNLIFIGSPAENPSLRELPETDFTLVALPDQAGYRNRHPLPGEAETYLRPEQPLTKDYAMIALLPGMQPGHRTLMLSGLTTLGTQAAVEFAIRPDSVSEMLRLAGKTASGEVRPFEALLETNISNGVPLETRLVTLHHH